MILEEEDSSTGTKRSLKSRVKSSGRAAEHSCSREELKVSSSFDSANVPSSSYVTEVSIDEADLAADNQIVRAEIRQKVPFPFCPRGDEGGEFSTAAPATSRIYSVNRVLQTERGQPADLNEELYSQLRFVNPARVPQRQSVAYQARSSASSRVTEGETSIAQIPYRGEEILGRGCGNYPDSCSSRAGEGYEKVKTPMFFAENESASHRGTRRAIESSSEGRSSLEIESAQPKTRKKNTFQGISPIRLDSDGTKVQTPSRAP